MLTVDCRNVESIKQELLVYVADQVGAIPAIKAHEFVLSPIDEDKPVSVIEVITSIREFLNSIDEQRNFAVVLQEGVILIESVTGKTIERNPADPHELFSCPHCGFLTRYEVEHVEHKKMHYL